MSRLQQRLAELAKQQGLENPHRAAERAAHENAGDGLEMAARTALEAWQARPRHADESDVFRLGYRLACHELALVFRAMRKGEPPNPRDFAELRRLVFEDSATEGPENASPLGEALHVRGEAIGELGGGT